MKEILFLNFGNTSNFNSTHFWNMNDEMFKYENKFNVDNSVLYNEYNYPRNLIFDYSENIRPYFMSNEKLSTKKIKEIEDSVKLQNKSSEIKTYEKDSSNVNKFLDMMNDFTIDDDEYNQFKKNYDNKCEDKYNKKEEEKIEREEIFRLAEDKVYEYLDFQNSVRNWNDFLQPRFSKRTFNEIMAADVDFQSRSSYIKGFQFLNSDSFNSSYQENFEDNFRRGLEDCDRVEVLHFNVDFNSFWGGICSKMIEDIDNMAPKAFKVIYGNDNHSSFYNKDDSFNVEKFINYLWFFTDLNSNKDSSLLFMPIFKLQNPSFIKNLFNFSYNPGEFGYDPVYEYYYSSLVGANLHNLYLPLRSKYYNDSKIIKNLIHSTSSSLNFIESDTILSLESTNEIQENKTCGVPFNFSRNINANDFNWKKLHQRYFNLNKYNISVIHGYHQNLTFLGEKIDGFLMKHSSVNYSSIDKIDIPISFPRKVIMPNKENVFLKDLSIMTNYRPFVEYPLVNLGYFPSYAKDFDLEIRKYLLTHDTAKYIELKEKLEDYYKLIDSYDFINENWNLGLKNISESDDEDN